MSASNTIIDTATNLAIGVGDRTINNVFSDISFPGRLLGVVNKHALSLLLPKRDRIQSIAQKSPTVQYCCCNQALDRFYRPIKMTFAS